jgi:hypothetical protein
MKINKMPNISVFSVGRMVVRYILTHHMSGAKARVQSSGAILLVGAKPGAPIYRTVATVISALSAL